MSINPRVHSRFHSEFTESQAKVQDFVLNCGSCSGPSFFAKLATHPPSPGTCRPQPEASSPKPAVFLNLVKG